MGPPQNYISSFPAGVHAPGFRLSAKVTKVEGCAWLDAHQSPDRSHSQRISNRGESYITFSLSGLYGNFRVNQRESADMVQGAEGAARFVASRSSELCPMPSCRGAAPLQDGTECAAQRIDAAKRAPPSAP